ncbi:hypothetical protein [Acinetobacter rongchengensis]|uniref:Uncharacterized protein n=1 Tax=Acinetobacter rongchengensis TaxID=2419601 RepID=A0A3A8F2H6_9GAMM|nr:hypothetical protein [Acinetobacter rongchengensis]RKG37260.1 hypothetical protein D7V20_11600 [Acinetobacter rongchengensis]
MVVFIIFEFNSLKYSPSIEYFEEEKLCGTYEYEDYAISSRPPYPKEYFIRFDKYGLFGFRNNTYPNRLNFENLKKGQKVCLVLKRRKDKGDDLKQAILILLETEQ